MGSRAPLGTSAATKREPASSPPPPTAIPRPSAQVAPRWDAQGRARARAHLSPTSSAGSPATWSWDLRWQPEGRSPRLGSGCVSVRGPQGSQVTGPLWEVWAGGSGLVDLLCCSGHWGDLEAKGGRRGSAHCVSTCCMPGPLGTEAGLWGRRHRDSPERTQRETSLGPGSLGLSFPICKTRAPAGPSTPTAWGHVP